MPANATVLVVVIVLFCLLSLGMFVIVLSAARKQAAQKAGIAQALGMTPLPDAPDLLQRLTVLHDTQRPERYTLQHVFQRRLPQGEVYYFSLTEGHFNRSGSGGRRTTQYPVDTDALAFISLTWHLPRFKATPRLGGRGQLAGIANRLAEAAIEIKHDVIKFPHILNLDEQYLIATPEVPASSVTLPDGFLRVLASYPKLQVNAGGDTLVLAYTNTSTNPPDEQRLTELYNIGQQLARELQVGKAPTDSIRTAD